MSADDVAAARIEEEPVEVGWYTYSGGAQGMIFHLRETGQWSAHFGNGTASDCAWGYIEQALGVWDLVRLDLPARAAVTAGAADDGLAMAWHEGHWAGVEMQHLIETGEDTWPDHLAVNPYGVPSALTGGTYVPPDDGLRARIEALADEWEQEYHMRVRFPASYAADLRDALAADRDQTGADQ